MERMTPNLGSGHRGRNYSNNERSVRAINLSRLAKVFDVDLLAAAVVLREEIVRAMVSGREAVRDEYAQEIGVHLHSAGFPSGWLDTPDAKITEKQLALLRESAAMSMQKSPIRRDNFKRLAKAFEGRYSLLADALEVVENSIVAIVSGTSVFDEHRMGHVNPRLMEAGFPDNWLEKPNAELNPEWLTKLESLAADSYEKALAEDEQARTDAAAAAAEATANAAAATEAANAAAANAAAATAAAAPTPSLTPKAKAPTRAAPQDQSKEDSTVGNSKPSVKTSATSPAVTGTPAQKPGLPAGLSRSMMASGRPTGGRVAPKPASKAPAQPSSTAIGVSLSDIAAKASTSADAGHNDKTTKEDSIRRAAALEKLLDTARRGAKVCLWRDLLGRSLPYWGNVKKGAITLRDDAYNAITAALGLPEGWLDNPEFPPQTLAPWVMDANVPLPAKPKKVPGQPAVPSAAKARAMASVGRAMSVKPAAPPIVAAPAPVAPAAPAAPAPKAALPAKPVVTRPVVPKPAKPVVTPVAAAPAAPVVAAAPAPTPAAAVASPSIPAAGQLSYSWSPNANPTPSDAPGPLTQVLVDQLKKMATAGTFTEQDALQMLYYMMSPRG